MTLHFPLHWQSKRQGSVACSSTEAELISNGSWFGEVYNLQEFIQQIIHTEMEVRFHQDNNALLQVLQNGNIAKLQRAGRVHHVNDPCIKAEYGAALCQKPNGLTKAVAPQEWPLTLDQYGAKKVKPT